MGRLSWYINRLRAMNVPEVFWRLSQKKIQRREAAGVSNTFIDVSERLLYPDIEGLLPDKVGKCIGGDSLPLEDEPFVSIFGDKACADPAIHLLGGYDYDDYRDRWDAGFNTPNCWPLTQSYSLQYKQCDAIGDARVNWEINRCFQLALLARRGDSEGLARTLKSWCKGNPWLRGISWTSVMEVAIRAIQWTVAAYYLSLMPDTGSVRDTKRRLETGALNMTKYVSLHYSRFSSANNHLLVEALCLVLVGSAFGISQWEDMGLKLLDDELTKQNYPDGVNKEMALHYQTFAMEAYALAILTSRRLAGKTPGGWIGILSNMCDFVAWSISAGTPMEWGDNDEGKILDLRGGKNNANHYEYVLRLFEWLGVYDSMGMKPLVKHFGVGGYTFARSSDSRVLIGIDHAPLGFGSIAAHGHADALSIQMIYDDKTIFADPGTYVYHCDIAKRNDLRRTINHNTLCVGSKDQSEMLGAFLWGKRANVTVAEIDYDSESGRLHLQAYHDGYSPVLHTRTVDFDGQCNISILDSLSVGVDYAVTYMLGHEVTPAMTADSEVTLSVDGRPVAVVMVEGDDASVSIEDAELSLEYGKLTPTKALRIRGKGATVNTKINLV